MANTHLPTMIRDGVLHLARLLGPKPMAKPVDLTGRQVIVTGASEGSMGYMVALLLARWGAQVVATGRSDANSLQQALRAELGTGGGSLTARGLDLADRDSVSAFANWYRERFGALHVLINNAGILHDLLALRRQVERSADGVEIHWRINYLGTFHLTSLLLPLLIDSAATDGDARVLNVTSHQHVRGRNDHLLAAFANHNPWDAYGQSKLALIHMAQALHRRHGGTGEFRALSLHPGSVYTNLVSGGLESYSRVRPIQWLMAAPARAALLSPLQGAQTTLFCATDADVQGGRYYDRCAVSQPSADALDASVAERLWALSEDWLAQS
ncbi:MAG: SDR family NAD(P)-dependent oxidoreductase [Gammaproteobacteria bacterium]|nr:SDR family NAD(P)-dependent oxidoreductase [Gammaproteobacteria bacterium]